MSHYALGLDFGTNSVRALIVDTHTGEEVETSVWNYSHGESGILIDPKDPLLARQHPQDYIDGTIASTRAALEDARKTKSFSPQDVIGIGVDTTGSTPLPVDSEGIPLALDSRFANNLSAMAWLWKDHTGHSEAEEITRMAAAQHPEYLAKCGGTYSSEWLWSKVLHCLRTSPEVYQAAASWVEIADWIPAFLTGTAHPSKIRRGICAAGHKAMFNPAWKGYPDVEFLAGIEPDLAKLRNSLPDQAYTVADTAGQLTEEYAGKLGLRPGIPVAVGAFDAHLGAVGCGITPGVLVKIIGTSTCDMMVSPFDQNLADIPGLCGIVPGSILPGSFGLEAGQSAVGDIFNWFVNSMRPGGPEAGSHEALTRGAEVLKPGESGLLGLDWHNGNRTVLVDQRLTGALFGMTLHTTPAEIYRTLIESTAFGARVILERFEEYGVKVERVVNCGGISIKNPLVMQILADVTSRTMEVSRSEQTCALGAAMAGAVVAGASSGGHADFASAAKAMTGIRDKKYIPDPKAVAVYEQLFRLYRRLHDIFGTHQYGENQFSLMKDLMAIRDKVRGV